MTKLEQVFAAASAVCQEATRRAFGDEADARFDVPLAMLLDLDEALGADLPSTNDPATADPQNGSEGHTGSQGLSREAARALGAEAVDRHAHDLRRLAES